MTNLSPAAQAVVAAAYALPLKNGQPDIAAALRAAAEAPPEIDIPFAIVEEWERIEGVCASFNAAAEWGHKQALTHIRAIAAELEACNS
jgi:hypothetical protein